MHFGYIYGFGMLGSLVLYAILSMMSERPLTFTCTVSVLGYCMLPLVLLSCIAVLFNLQ